MEQPGRIRIHDELRITLEGCNLGTALGKLTETAGLGPWTPTELGRHVAGSLMSARGVPNGVIASLYGHSTTRMVETHYLHPVVPTIGGHVEAMEKLFCDN